MRTDQGVASFIAEMARARNAAIRETSATGGWISARNSERSEVQVLRGIAGVTDRPHHLRTCEAFSATVEIVFKIVIQLERLPGLRGDDAVEAPAVGDALPAAFVAGKLINEIPGEAVANIKVGVAAIGTDGRGAVVRLRGIGNIVFAVAGVVDGMGPGVVQCGRKSMPIGYAQAGLQGVVIGIGGRLLVVDVEERRSWEASGNT